MTKKGWLKNLPLFLLAAAIAFSPSFSVGVIEGERVIELRIEDFLIVILGLAWLASFLISRKKKIEKPPLLLPILAWIGIGFFSLLTNWIFTNLSLSRGFFYFLKEIEFFFLYFYLFYHIKSLDSAKFLVKTWLFLGAINVLWIIFEIITGFRLIYYYGQYGPTIFAEPEGPLPSGGFFLMIFIFLLNIFLYYYFELAVSNLKKGVLMLFLISPSIGVFASGSRASFLGLVLALFLTFLIYFFKKKDFKPFLVSILILILISFAFIFISEKLPAIKRSLNLERMGQEFITTEASGSISRLDIWKAQLSEALKHPLFLLFGLGKSVRLFCEESHSQYVRNFIETGIIGSLVFLLLIFVIIKKAFQGFSKIRDPFSIGLSAGLLVATLTMLFVSISAEAFMVVKIAEVYWFFTALTMAVLNLSKKEQLKE